MEASERDLSPGRYAVRTTLVSVMANIALATVKGLAGILGHSYALVADAMESVMDVARSLIVLGGLHIAATPPDSNHPYGHGKAEPLAAVVVALGILGGAVGLAVQSVREIMSPQYSPEPYTLIVLVVVIAVKESLFRFVGRVSAEVKSTAMQSDAWDHRSDVFTSSAAFIGISVALIGGEGYESADGWAALVACGIIGYNGYRVIRPALAEIMDASPPPEVEQEVRRLAQTVDGVAGLDVCFVRKMGLEYFVDLHVLVDGGISVLRGHQIAHDVKDAIRAALPTVRDVLIHIEPAP